MSGIRGKSSPRYISSRISLIACIAVSFKGTSRLLDTDKDRVKDTYEYAVEYLYAQNRLSGIDTGTTEYTLTYDIFGNMLSVKAGENTLATYTYSGNNGKLQRLEYGNGDFETYEYDHLDRLVKVYYNDNEEPTYFVTFDTNGRVSSVKDGNITHIYEYDSLGLPEILSSPMPVKTAAELTRLDLLASTNSFLLEGYTNIGICTPYKDDAFFYIITIGYSAENDSGWIKHSPLPHYRTVPHYIPHNGNNYDIHAWYFFE